jgi:transposase-like protein
MAKKVNIHILTCPKCKKTCGHDRKWLRRGPIIRYTCRDCGHEYELDESPAAIRFRREIAGMIFGNR